MLECLKLCTYTKSRFTPQYHHHHHPSPNQKLNDLNWNCCRNSMEIFPDWKTQHHMRPSMATVQFISIYLSFNWKTATVQKNTDDSTRSPTKHTQKFWIRRQICASPLSLAWKKYENNNCMEESNSGIIRFDSVASGKTRIAKAMQSMTKREEKVGGLMGEWNTLAKCRQQRLFIKTRAKIISIHMEYGRAI